MQTKRMPFNLKKRIPTLIELKQNDNLIMKKKIKKDHV